MAVNYAKFETALATTSYRLVARLGDTLTQQSLIAQVLYL